MNGKIISLGKHDLEGRKRVFGFGVNVLEIAEICSCFDINYSRANPVCNLYEGATAPRNFVNFS